MPSKAFSSVSLVTELASHLLRQVSLAAMTRVSITEVLAGVTPSGIGFNQKTWFSAHFLERTW